MDQLRSPFSGKEGCIRSVDELIPGTVVEMVTKLPSGEELVRRLGVVAVGKRYAGRMGLGELKPEEVKIESHPQWMIAAEQMTADGPTVPVNVSLISAGVLPNRAGGYVAGVWSAMTYTRRVLEPVVPEAPQELLG